MAITAPAPEIVEMRTCKDCGETKPLTAFVLNNRAGYLKRCKACKNAAARVQNQQLLASGDQRGRSSYRERRARVRESLGWEHIDYAPDPQPARLLSELLSYDRDFGLEFEQAWEEGTSFVLSRIDGVGKLREREQWRAAFEATRDGWAAAWDRRPGPGAGLARGLLDGFDSDKRYDTAQLG